MHRTQRCLLTSGCSTYFEYALRAPQVENPTGHDTSPPSQRDLMNNAGCPVHDGRRLMKWSTLVIGLAITVVLAAPVAAQQSLGDVAGSIKLKRPEGESVVIDRDSVAQSRQGPTGGTDSELFQDIVGDCLTETAALHDLVEETRNGTSFYRDPWRDRVEEVGFQLDGALE